MKRGFSLILIVLLSSIIVSASGCDPTVSLVNQDPYPAVPGESVDLVFQVDGLSSSECGNVVITLEEKFPFTVDPSTPKTIEVKSGTFINRDYESFVMAPYRVRVNEDALDGNTPIELTVKRNGGTESYPFDINIEDSRADFEIYVKDYDYSTRELTLEILNIEDSDVEAVTVYIPKQDNIEVKGANRITVGDIDSNEYTTTDFEAIMSDGDFEVEIFYSDSINERRSITKTLSFDSSYFTNRVSDEKSTSFGTYIVYLLVIVGAVWFWRKRNSKKKIKA
jgi:hypothetical protein